MKKNLGIKLVWNTDKYGLNIPNAILKLILTEFPLSYLLIKISFYKIFIMVNKKDKFRSS